MTALTSIDRVRAQHPLIFNITNAVVTDLTANGLLAVGASPVMSNALEEAADMAAAADALVLNIGTPSAAQVEAMLAAGRAANQHGIPVVLDPVGVGATPFRNRTVRTLLDELELALIRGNAGELGYLAGLDSRVSGVDATAGADTPAIAERACEQLGLPVLVTGREDAMTDGSTLHVVRNGHPLLSRVTGTGCLLSSITAAFLACDDQVMRATADATGFYGVAAELAAAHGEGPGSFRHRLLDRLAELDTAGLTPHLQLD
ncbi:hydroxyethylthiazole kinase [Kushneria sinocarnis]|uniref:Hydroxyethylthiazole kinase n=2 Tax=Kushneria sinocarnis TaxID=595502 RepID=A0A420WZW9_9GAMM|nr:hydroxyethylthiazole kinase [Kushneria sinocarnis]